MVVPMIPDCAREEPTGGVIAGIEVVLACADSLP